MVTMHFRAVNFKAGMRLKEYAKKRIEKLSLFHKQIFEVFIFAKVENSSDGFNKWAELKIEIPGDYVVVKKISRSFEESIHNAAESAARILKKRKGKERS